METAFRILTMIDYFKDWIPSKREKEERRLPCVHRWSCLHLELVRTRESQYRWTQSAECRGKRFAFPSNILSKVVEISHLDNLAPHNDNLAAETVMGEIMRLLLKDTTQFSKGTFPYGKPEQSICIRATYYFHHRLNRMSQKPCWHP